MNTLQQTELVSILMTQHGIQMVTCTQAMQSSSFTPIPASENKQCVVNMMHLQAITSLTGIAQLSIQDQLSITTQQVTAKLGTVQDDNQFMSFPQQFSVRVITSQLHLPQEKFTLTVTLEELITSSELESVTLQKGNCDVFHVQEPLTFTYAYCDRMQVALSVCSKVAIRLTSQGLLSIQFMVQDSFVEYILKPLVSD